MEFIVDKKRESVMSDLDLTRNLDWKLNPNVDCRVALEKMILPTEKEPHMNLDENSVENGGGSRTEYSLKWSDANTDVDTSGYLRLKLLIHNALGIFPECEEKCVPCDNYIKKLWNHLMESHVGKPTDSEHPHLTKNLNFGVQNLMNKPRLNTTPSYEDEESSEDVKPLINPPEHVDYYYVTNENLKHEPEDIECQEDPQLNIQQHLNCEEDIIENTKYTDMHTAQTRTNKGFQCLLCPKSFTIQEHLSRHNLIHTGERPFKCETCGKGFAMNYHLTVHMRIHTDKKFSCNKCGKKFATNVYLSRHEKIVHTEDKPFKCITCGKGFVLKCALEKHMTTHSNIRPFKCVTCGKSFMDLYCLSRHKLSHNSKKQRECDV